MVGPEVVERALAEAGIGFMMAPMHHPAMRNVMPARTELGTRTIFNILGPLTNPASVRRQLTGAFSRAVIRPMAETLGRARLRPRLAGPRRRRHRRGLDQPARPTSPSSTTARSANSRVHPEDAGLAPHPLAAVLGGAPAANARALRGLLAGEASRLSRRGAAQRRRRPGRRRPRRRACARASRWPPKASIPAPPAPRAETLAAVTNAATPRQ